MSTEINKKLKFTLLYYRKIFINLQRWFKSNQIVVCYYTLPINLTVDMTICYG